MRLALGTAQFGLDYGVANSKGKVKPDQVKSILAYAAVHGVDTLDTAIAYGDSERCLGEVGVAGWEIVSKLPTPPQTSGQVDEWVRTSLFGSLRRLHVPKLKGVLLHRSQDLLGSYGKRLYQAITSLKEQKLVEKIGVSIYDPAELDALWSDYRFDLIQVPFNILDRRIVSSGWLERLSLAGVEVHARSAFMQGLLLMPASTRPKKFQRWQPLWQEWDNWLAGQGISALQACLGFVLGQSEISRVVVGVDSLDQLQEILSWSPELNRLPPLDLYSADEDLINPSRWSLL